MQKAIFEVKTVKNKEIEKHLIRTQKRFKDFFGVSFELPRVFLFKSRNQMSILFQRKLSKWHVGNSDGNYVCITKDLLKIDPERFWKVLTHEYAHMAIHVYSQCNHIKPRWLNEGLSCYLAKQWKPVMAQKLTKDSLNLYFDKTDNYIFPLGYNQVRMLIERYGKLRILKLLKQAKKINNKKDFNKIFKNIYKIDLPIMWKKIKETKHFIFYIYGRPKLEKNYYEKCEKHLQKIYKIFGFKFRLKDKINYCILPNEETYTSVLGWKPTGRVYGNNIYSVYAFHPHEIIHMLFRKNVNEDSIRILSEGVAVLYGWNRDGQPRWRGKSLEFWMNKYMKKISIMNLINDFNQFDTQVSYPISACFVQFLINNYGITKFKKLYRRLNGDMSLKEKEKIFREVTKLSIRQLDKDFHDSCKAVGD